MITATRDTFQDMFDDDDNLEYEPSQTAAIILTGGDEEAEKAALEARLASRAPSIAILISNASRAHSDTVNLRCRVRRCAKKRKLPRLRQRRRLSRRST